jgi:glycosyltransferase involved in cell wall biosynthesis/ADP-heptose:LPS heptosyltransferase
MSFPWRSPSPYLSDSSFAAAGQALRDAPRRVLAVCTHRLGDTIVALPAVQALRDAFPEASLSLVAARPYHRLLRCQGYVDRLVAPPADDRDLRSLARRHDFTVLFRRWSGSEGADPEPACVTLTTDLFIGAPRPAHVQYLETLRTLGFPARARRPRLLLDPTATRASRRSLRAIRLPHHPLVAVHAGSFYEGKRWPAEGYAEVLSRLHASYGARFLFIQGDSEPSGAADLVGDLPRGCYAVLAGRSLSMVAAVLAGCTFAVGNDTGILHLADAVGLPTITIFGPSRAGVWGAVGPAAVHVTAEEAWHGCTSCGSRWLKDKPCARPETQSCLRMTRPEDVLAAVESVAALIGLRRRFRRLDAVRLSPNLERLRGRRGPLMLVNASYMRPLVVTRRADRVLRCVRAVERSGSYRSASRAVEGGRAILDALLAHRCLLPDGDREAPIPDPLRAARREMLRSPIMSSLGGLASATRTRASRVHGRRTTPEVRRVLFVNSITPDVYGGGERWSLRVARALAERGHDVLCWGSPGHPWLADAQEWGLTTLTSPIPETFDLAQIPGLARQLAELRVSSAVLSQDREIVSIGPALRFAGVDRVYARKGLPGFDDRPVARWAYRSVMAGVIVPAQSTKRDLVKKGGMRASHVHVICNGVDADRFRSTPGGIDVLRTDLGIEPRDPVILAVSRLAEHKGIHHLVQAVPSLRARWPRAHVLIVGHGPDAARLRREAELLGCDDTVRFLGERRDTERMFALADCFVLPSLYEGMSSALLEAMAAGVPVVATAVSGAPEVVRTGKTGTLVPPADPVALANAIADVLRDPLRFRRMSHAAQEYVRAHHSLEEMVDRVAALLGLSSAPRRRTGEPPKRPLRRSVGG